MERRRLNGLAVWLVAVAVVVAIVAGSFYLAFVEIPRRLADAASSLASGTVRSAAELGGRLAKEIHARLKISPAIVVDEKVVVSAPVEILELATVEQALTVTYTYEATFLGSTKSVTLRGDYIAKAGFDLDESFAIRIGTSPLRLDVAVGAPRILSVSLEKCEIEETHGYWNRLTGEDHADAIAAMLKLARGKAVQEGILERARINLENRIRQAILDSMAPTQFKFGSEPPSRLSPLTITTNR